jgi:hypothetical protein
MPSVLILINTKEGGPWILVVGITIELFVAACLNC